MTETEAPSAPSQQPSRRGSGFVRAVRVLGWTFIGLGVFLLGFVAQQLFVTTYFAQQANEGLAVEAQTYFDEVEITEVPYVPTTVPGEVLPEPADPDLPPPTLLVEAPRNCRSRSPSSEFLPSTGSWMAGPWLREPL
jgi:hypothetical protein